MTFGLGSQVILLDEDVDRWLSGAKFEDLKGLLKPYSGSDLKWHPVDKKGKRIVDSLHETCNAV